MTSPKTIVEVTATVTAIDTVDASVTSGGLYVTREFVDLERDLGVVPVTEDVTEATAATNVTKLNGYFNSTPSPHRALVVPGRGYLFTDTIMTPTDQTGHAMICMGATDLRGETEYPDGVGGPASRFIRIGSSTNPIFETGGYGLNIIGTLNLEGLYDGGDRATKVAAMKAAIAAGTAPVGLMVRGNLNTTLANGKLNIQGLTAIGCSVGIQFAETQQTGDPPAQVNNADDSWIGWLFCWNCETSIKILGSQVYFLNFGMVGSAGVNNIVLVGEEDDVLNAGGKIMIQQASMLNPLNTGDVSTLFKIHSTSRTTSQFICNQLIVDGNAEKPTLVDMPIGSTGGPAHIIIGGHKGETEAGLPFNPGMVRKNTTVTLRDFYQCGNQMFDTESNAGSGYPVINFEACRFSTNTVTHPEDAIRTRTGTNESLITWHACQGHAGDTAIAIPDGKRVDADASQYVTYS